jgi:ketosteroid isomerase-like protein
MKVPGPTHALAAFLIAACAPKEAPLSAERAGAITDSVRTTLDAYRDRLNATDRDSLVRFYDDDPRFTLAADGKIATHTVAQVRAEFDGLSSFKVWHIEYKNPVIVPLSPGLASVSAEYAMTLTDSAGKGPAFGGAMTLLWIHTRSGWKILNGHSSSAPRAVPEARRP